MADPVANPPATVEWTTNERITSDFLNKMADASDRSIFHILAWLFRDHTADTPRSGFPGARDCLVSLNLAPLTVQVGKGTGFYYDSAAGDAFATHYKPVWVPATEVLAALGGHDVTNPRIDIVCLAPAVDTDEAASVYVRNPTTRAVSTTSIDTRQVPSHTTTVVAGTPAANPVAPTTPAGNIKLADVFVPAASGTVTITDTRPILQLGDGWAPEPPLEYIQAFIPGSSTELQVTALGTPAMYVRVRPGEAVLRATYGTRRHRIGYPAGSQASIRTIAIAAADPTNPRIDLVSVNESGTIVVTTGTPAATPAEPALPSKSVALAAIDVGAAVTTIVAGNINDRRLRQPFPDYPIKADPTIDVSVAGQADALIQLADKDGNPIGKAGVRLLVELFWVPSAGLLNPHTTTTTDAPCFNILFAIGTQIESSTDSTVWVGETNRNGQIWVRMGTGISAATRLMKITPINTPGIVTFTKFIVT